MPMAVRPAPSMAWGVKPSSRTRASMASWASRGTSGCRTMSMGPILVRSEPEVGGQSRAGKPGGRRHALLAFGLYLDELPAGAFAAGHDLAPHLSRSAGGRRDRPRLVDLEDALAHRRPGARPGGEAAPPRVEVEGAP